MAKQVGDFLLIYVSISTIFIVNGVVNMSKNETELSIPLDENQYEWVELPSRGECYPHKKGKVPVAYMTAMDENIIISEELREKKKVAEVLLSNKILDKSFDVKSLCIGDRDALLIWLRKTSYGNELKISQTDSEGKLVENTIDLDKITYNTFNATADENGLVEYVTDKKELVKYRLLTYEDEDFFYDKVLNLINTMTVSTDSGIQIVDLMKELLIKQTVSVNGNVDKNCIVSFIDDMELSELFKYVSFTSKNTPRANINIRIGDSIFDDIK